MKRLISTIVKLYDLKIILSFILIYTLICTLNISLIPDYFDFRKIENPDSFFITLWSVIVGSSSIILAILLVVYSSFSKTIKRNSLDFIIENPWIRIIFSIFAGSFIYVSLSIIGAQVFAKSTVLTLLYTSFFIAVFYILLQFPLVVLSLKYSNSYKRIKKLLQQISNDDINNLFSPPKEKDGVNFIENLEKNKIILLKDLGIHAIMENDWSLPQSIINELYTILIEPLNKDFEKKKITVNLWTFTFVCNHFKNYAIAESDFITTKVLLAILLKTHRHLAKNEIRKLRNNPLDEYAKDIYRLIIGNNNFYNIQPYILSDIISIIRAHIGSSKYTDQELPTLNYLLDNRENSESDLSSSELIRFHWFYLKNELPDLFFDTLTLAIESRNINVYNHFNFHLHSLLTDVYDSKNLTEYQREDAFKEYFYRAKRICDLAIKNKIYENINIVSSIQIEAWLINKRKNAFLCLNYFTDLVLKLNNKNQLSSYYIDELFIIARKISTQKMDLVLKTKSIRIILETGFLIYEKENSSEIVKTELLTQFDWLNSYLTKENDLLVLSKEFSEKINDLIKE